jgi:cobalt/nickel transport system permease protein
MNLEPFAVGTSPIHRLDPRVRIVAAALFSIAVAAIADLGALVLALAAGLILVFAARLPWRALTGRLSATAGFLLLLWLVLPLTQPGRPLAHLGPLAIQDAGVMLSVRISLKTASILLAFTALAATMTAATLGHGLQRLGLPPKLTFLMLMCYRYLSVLQQEYRRLVRAARIRGFRPATDTHTYRTYAYLVGMLFVRAARRADRVYQAMRCRGFDGRFHSLAHFAALGRREAAFGALMVLTISAMVMLDVLAKI